MTAVSAQEKLAQWRLDPRIFVREVFGAVPDAWQDEVLEAFPHCPRVAMKACAGPGKAQPKDTVIPTPEGRRRFGDLKPGDRVFTGDGSITTVKAVYDRGVLPVYRISFDDSSSTLACGEHLWKVRGRTERRHFSMRQNGWSETRERRARAQGWSVTPPDGYVVLSTEQIIARNKCRDGAGRRQFEIPRQGPAQYPSQRLPLDPYVLGVWLGDGVRMGGKYATKPTAEIQHEINGRGYETSPECGGIVTVYGIVGRLRDLGVLPLYSYERFVPEIYLFGSIRDRMDILCGLMDTDGGVDADGHMQFASTSERLAKDVMWLVRSLGGTAHQAKTKLPFYYGPNRRKIAGRPCYRVVIRLPFNPFRVPERKARWVDPSKSPATLRYMTRMIDRIEPAGGAECMCIEVEHASALYLTNDFIVTHNTAVLAWVGWNYMVTRPHPRCGATSINGANLKAGLWTELAFWRNRSPMLKAAFEMTSNKIFSREYPETWKIEARTWAKDANSEQIGNALRGIHGPYVMWILDESGGYPDAILPVCENIFAGNPDEAHIVQAGNPTNLSGPLYHACTQALHLWKVVEITGDPDDPKRSPRIPIEHARQQIQQYGRDNPWVLVNILGRFPPASIDSLIGIDEVRDAMKREYHPGEYEHEARILGADVAQFGDDASVVFPRQGLMAFPPLKYRNVNGPTLAGHISRKWQDWDADGCFVDNTGGYGASCIDHLIALGRTPIPVLFSGEPNDKRYYNKRAEMYFEAVQWIKRGGALPPVPELAAALTKTTYTMKKDRLLLIPKAQVKDLLGYSPDDADAFVQTFAQIVVPKPRSIVPGKPQSNDRSNYDPMAEMWKVRR